LLAAVATGINTRLHASPVPFVSGSANGAAWNHAQGTPTSCGYSAATSIGQCGYVSSGILVEDPSHGSGWYGFNNSFTASLSSSADNNGLHANAQLDVFGFPLDQITRFNHYGSSYFNQATASADFFDTLTAVGPGTGLVDMVVKFNLDGDVYAFGSGANAYATVTMNSNYGSGSVNVGNPHTGTNSIVPVQQTISFTFHNLTVGQQFNYSLQLDANVYVSDSISFGDSPKLSTVDAVANFSNTLQFSSISFQNAAGAPLSGYSVDSTSGFNYDQFLPGAPAPEPGSVALSLGGLVLVGVSLRLRR
jgi:hypothetical protein